MTSVPEARVLEAVGRESAAALADIRAAIRQPSVSRTGEGLQAMANWITAYVAGLGATVRQVPGQKAPIVEGTLESDRGLPTLLLYDLYDVQPAAGQPGWSAPPFAASIIAGPDGRDRLIGRGAFNSKGPLVGTLATLHCFQHAGVPIPCNIRFLFEGEEEIGSPSLPGYIDANRAALAACDAAFIPYFGTNTRGETVLRLRFKGLALLEFRVEGGVWGGPARGDIHALHGALVASPAWELVRALATLLDGQGRFAPDGLDAIMPLPNSADLALVVADAARFDPARHAADLGTARLARDAPPRELLAEWMFACTLNIDALSAGRIETCPGGDDAATLIPRTARCFADLRVVPVLAPDAVLGLIRAHLDRRGFRHVQANLRSAYPASRAATDAPVVRALIDACRQHAGDLRVLPIHPGAAPMYVFSEMIGIPYAFGGVGHGGGAHGPDEVHNDGRHHAVYALDRQFSVPLRRCPE